MKNKQLSIHGEFLSNQKCQEKLDRRLANDFMHPHSVKYSYPLHEQ